MGAAPQTDVGIPIVAEAETAKVHVAMWLERVSEEELRLIVMGAKQSGGIETEEAKMVEGVLDLQDMRVSEVMKPRINVEALEANATLVEFMELVNTTKYSRIPVYDTEIDQIMGVAIAKDLLV